MGVAAARALYIKLGRANKWAPIALASNTLRFGFQDISHQQALLAARANDFAVVKDYYVREQAIEPGAATRFSNEVREFYTAGAVLGC